MTEIALFGTSANPPTAAHKVILKWLSDHYDQVVVWASDNPFKSHQTPLEDRTTMLRVLIEEIETTQNNINLHQEMSSPKTLETVEKAKEVWRNQTELTLVVGSDLISQIPNWHRPQELLRQVKLLVIPRPGYQVDKEGVEKLKKLGAEVAIADLQVPAVSSTKYREQGDSEVVTPPVEDYIHQKQLYACQNAAPSK